MDQGIDSSQEIIEEKTEGAVGKHQDQRKAQIET